MFSESNMLYEMKNLLSDNAIVWLSRSRPIKVFLFIPLTNGNGEHSSIKIWLDNAKSNLRSSTLSKYVLVNFFSIVKAFSITGPSCLVPFFRCIINWKSISLVFWFTGNVISSGLRASLIVIR